MSPIIIGLVLVSSFIHAIRDFITKKSGDKQAFVLLYELSAVVIYFPLFVIVLFKELPINISGVYIAFAAGIIHFFYWIFLTKSLHSGDLSHVYPIARAAPALVLILSVVFLNEKVSFSGVSGILLVTTGIYLLHLKSFNSFSAIFEPIRSISTHKASQYAFLTLLTVSFYSITDKIGVSYIHPILYLYLINLSAIILFIPYVLMTKTKETILNEWNNYKSKAILNGILVLGGYLLILIAFTMGKVSYITGLRQISIVFAVLLGGHILKEKHKNIRLIASFIIFLGAFLISTAE